MDKMPCGALPSASPHEFEGASVLIFFVGDHIAQYDFDYEDAPKKGEATVKDLKEVISSTRGCMPEGWNCDKLEFRINMQPTEEAGYYDKWKTGDLLADEDTLPVPPKLLYLNGQGGIISPFLRTLMGLPMPGEAPTQEYIDRFLKDKAKKDAKDLEEYGHPLTLVEEIERGGGKPWNPPPPKPSWVINEEERQRKKAEREAAKEAEKQAVADAEK